MRIPPSRRRATQLALFQLSPGAGRLPQRQTVAFLGRGSGVGRHCVPSRIDSVDLKYDLCQIDSYCRNLHDGRSLSVKWSDHTSTLAQLTP